jgi:TRAP-type transport system periplasmic protein
MKNCRSLAVVLAILLIFTFAVSACAQQAPTSSQPQTSAPAPEKPIELRFGSTYSLTEPDGIVSAAWIEKIHKETNNRVHITPYWGGTLITFAESEAQIAKGIADMGSLGGGPAGLSILWGIGPFFCKVPNMETSLRIYLDLYAKYPEMQKEVADVKLLSVGSAGPFVLHTNTKPVRTLQDLKGLTVRATPVYQGVFKSLGAEGIMMGMGDIYISLQKGILDGAFTPYEILKSNKLIEVTKYSSNLRGIYSPRPAYGMNWNTWNSLPPDIQKVFDSNFEWFNNSLLQQHLKLDQEAMELGKQQGHEFIQMSPDDVNKWLGMMSEEALKSAAKLDAGGLPGTKIFDDVNNLIIKYK